MADTIIARDEGKTYTPHPEGTFQGVCVDVIDLGDKPETFPGAAPKLAHKILIVWQTAEVNPDTGKPYELSKEFTLSMNEKSSLRKFLGLWRGKSYTDEEAKAGAPLHKLEGVNCTLTVEHKVSGKGRTYANVLNVAPWPKGASQRKADGYERGEFYTKRKDEYAELARQFRAANAPALPPRRDPEAVLAAAAAEGDDLPF